MKTSIQERSNALKIQQPSLKNYEDLKKYVAALFLAGKKRAQEAIEREKIRTYWQIGKSIHQHVLESGRRADYGKQVIRRLSSDLKTNETLLYYALQFSRTYDELPDSEKLSWSHYRALLPLKTPAERTVWEAKAEEWGWSSRDLETAIGEAKKTSSLSNAVENIKRGDLYIYKVLQAAGKGFLRIDLGFSCAYCVRLSSSSQFYEGDVIKSVFDGRKSDYFMVRAQPPRPEDLYNYRARFEKVDQRGFLLFDLDLGFDFHIQERLRFTGPEQFSGKSVVEKNEHISSVLSGSTNLTVKTLGRDKSGCFVCEVFVAALPLTSLLKGKMSSGRAIKRKFSLS